MRAIFWVVCSSLTMGTAWGQNARLTDDRSYPLAGQHLLTVAGPRSNDGLNRAFLKFDFSTLPTNVQPADISKATLVLFADTLDTAGAFDVGLISTPWTESANAAPLFSSPVVSGVQVAAANQYVSVDLTTTVRSWLGGVANQGIALTANASTPRFDAAFDSKENPNAGHEARLEITVEPNAAIASLQAQVAALQASLNQEIANRQAGDSATLASVQGFVGAALAALGLSSSGKEVFFTGVNVHVINGTGATGNVNGLGNLTVGYNESRGGGLDQRGGSHNFIVGEAQNYTSFGGLVAGNENQISGPLATVLGGDGNTASGTDSSVCGGASNSATGIASTVSGGGSNTASGVFSTVSGGFVQTASAQFGLAPFDSLAATVAALPKSDLTALEASVAANTAKLAPVSISGSDYVISGMNVHVVSGSGATNDNGAATGLGNLIVGYNEDGGGPGSHNLITGQSLHYTSFGGFVAGFNNAITAPYATVSGGSGNEATGIESSISGGTSNLASGRGATISGKNAQTASADLSLVPFDGLAATVAALQLPDLTALQASVAALNAKTAPISIAGSDFVITGMNVHVVSGSGGTNDGGGALSGLGNLIVGYNEGGGGTGSHNLIVGEQQSYTSFGGFVAGNDNAIYAPFATVTGGDGNTASGAFSTISGGDFNATIGISATISGGSNNIASGFAATVSGGISQKTSVAFSLAPYDSLAAAVAALSPASLTALQASVTALQTTVGGFTPVLGHMALVTDSFTNTPTLLVSGVNLQLVSGLGSTDEGTASQPGPLSGLGNLIVGYDESRAGLKRNGAHNLVVGQFADYESYGGFVAGFGNTISAPLATVSGGNGNTASATNASVSGGSGNTASGGASAVNGGLNNLASGFFATVSGGQQNSSAALAGLAPYDGLNTTLSASAAKLAPISVTGNDFTITGKNVHIVSGSGSTSENFDQFAGLGNLIIGYNEQRIGGDVRTGAHNLIVGDRQDYSSYGGIVAGLTNTISGEYASVIGGEQNSAAARTSSVTGGRFNTADALFATVSGGFSNFATGNNSSVGGGENNTASGDSSTVCGGLNQSITTEGAVAAPDGSLNQSVTSLQTDDSALQATVAALSATLAPVSLSGSDLFFTGVNVHVVSGSGVTSDHSGGDEGQPLTGLGNLIVGYNGGQNQGFERSGSHNLIVGDNQSYASYGGLVAGFQNTIGHPWATVTGGFRNSANGSYSSVSGGNSNTADGQYSSVSGGQNNFAQGQSSSVSGGEQNFAEGQHSSVSGGTSNQAIDVDSSVSGGFDNAANALAASVCGGQNNTANAEFSSVSGGDSNIAGGDTSSVSGGVGVTASSIDAWAAGGSGAGTYHAP